MGGENGSLEPLRLRWLSFVLPPDANAKTGMDSDGSSQTTVAIAA
jgi:hypothetical protein